MTWQHIVGAGRWHGVGGIILAVSVAACSSSKDTTGPGGTGTTAPPPDTAFTQFIGRSYSVGVGSQEYECTSYQATADTYIKGFRTAPGPAQYTLFVTESSTPPAQMGDYDCDGGAILSTRLLYMSGPGTQDITFDSATGLHVKKGDYVGLVLQIVNAGAATTGTTNVLVQTAKAAEITNVAEAYLVGTLNLAIPPDGQVHTATGGCVHPDTAQQVIGVLPSMNSLGTHATITATNTSGSRTLYDGDYRVSQQLYHPLTGAMINVNEAFELTCSFVNDTGAVVNFGDASTDERCWALVYAQPTIGAESLDCVTG
jgi:hypothetical protein